MTEKIKCLRCGKCCWYPDIDGLWRRCKYLAIDHTGFTTCIRYHKRLGTNIDIETGAICVCRVELPYNIPGCPYNQPGRKPHTFWK